MEREGQIVGTAGYYPIDRAPKAVEIRKMYLLPAARGQGLGRFLLEKLEEAIAAKGFGQIWIETAAFSRKPLSYMKAAATSRRRVLKPSGAIAFTSKIWSENLGKMACGILYSAVRLRPL